MVANPETIGGAIEDVRAFCTVVELGSISAAARQLGETKGSISRRVSRLERRLGAMLLARTARSVTATEEGVAYFAKARDGLALLEDAAEGARRSRAVPRGHLRVTAPHDLGLEVLPPLITAFRVDYPQITVELILSDALLDLAANRIDVALRASSEPLPDMAYRASTLADFRIALFASPDYLRGRVVPARPADLDNHDLIASRVAAPGAARYRLEDDRGRPTEITRKPALYASDFAGVHRLLMAGGGIGEVPDIVAAAAVTAGQLVPVLPEWTVARARLHAITVGGRDAPARVSVFRDFVRRRLGGTP